MIVFTLRCAATFLFFSFLSTCGATGRDFYLIFRLLLLTSDLFFPCFSSRGWCAGGSDQVESMIGESKWLEGLDTGYQVGTRGQLLLNRSSEASQPFSCTSQAAGATVGGERKGCLELREYMRPAVAGKYRLHLYQHDNPHVSNDSFICLQTALLSTRQSTRKSPCVVALNKSKVC